MEQIWAGLLELIINRSFDQNFIDCSIRSMQYYSSSFNLYSEELVRSHIQLRIETKE